ncbi:hypothetical protein ACFSGI_02355 [Paenibacillus nicotianae]|uniref:Uncharacterized protein n=1 Tax=Paenibacillus nicotianae TaxID=1526551 RepID=A0ABW4UTA1_9BACL
MKQENFEELSFRINISTVNINYQNVMRWLKNAPFFEVAFFQADDIKKFQEPVAWKSNYLNEFFEKLHSFKYPIFSKFKDSSGNSVLLGIGKKNSFLLFHIYNLQASLQQWVEYIKYFFENENIGIVACIYPKDDLFWQRNTDPKQYELMGKSLENIKLIPFNKVKSFIDTISLPGYPEYVDDLWFGSTWKMIYGEEYFQFIAKDKLLSYSNAYQIEKLKNNAISITLFPNYEDYSTDEARRLQQDFKDYIKMKD